MQYDNEELVADEFEKLFDTARTKSGTTAGRLAGLSALHQLFINDYADNFLPVVISLTTGKKLSENSQDSYKSGIVSALLKLRAGEKLTSDENSYTRMFERYVDALKEFNKGDSK